MKSLKFSYLFVLSLVCLSTGLSAADMMTSKQKNNAANSNMRASSSSLDSSNPSATEDEDQSSNVRHKSMTSARSRSATGSSSEILNVVEIGTANPSFSTFLKVLKAADLVSVLQTPGPFTIFVPNNKAFEKLPPETLKEWLKPQNKDLLTSILTYHIVPGKIMSDEVRTTKLRTINSQPLEINLKGKSIEVNDAKVINMDISGSNGVIYEIDSVLIPPQMK